MDLSISNKLWGVLKWQGIRSDSKLLFYLLSRLTCEQGKEWFKGCCGGGWISFKKWSLLKSQTAQPQSEWYFISMPAWGAQSLVAFFFHEKLQLWFFFLTTNICYSSCWVALLNLNLCTSNWNVFACLLQPACDNPRWHFHSVYQEPGRLKHFRTADS